MKRLNLLPILAFVLSITIGFFITNVNAEESIYRVTNYLTKLEYIPVADVDKHIVGTYERRGVAVFENGEIATHHTIGTFDFVDSNGPFQGYSTMTFKDGSTTIDKYDATMTKESGKMPTLKGKSEYIKGTGKYEGIKGTITFTGEYLTPYNEKTKGDIILDASRNYTLAK
ncbi:MAG: hypothetical protein WCA42_13095 [Desulfobacterales bacterium]